MAQKHLIGKQVLELEIDSSKDAYAIQQKMSQWTRKELNPALEKLFDVIADEETTIQFNTIEIDIGDINLENGSFDEFTNRIITVLEQTIRNKLGNTTSLRERKKPFDKRQIREFLDFGTIDFSNNNTSDDGSNNNHDSWTTKKKKKIDSESSSGLVSQPRRRYFFEAWLHWLQKGSLPSYSMLPEDNWISMVLETLGLDLDAVTVLENKLKKYPIALERLVVQHKPEDLKSIVELYTGFSQSVLLKIIEEIQLLFQEQQSDIDGGKSMAYRNVEINIWKILFETVIVKRQKQDSESLGAKVLRHFVSKKVISSIQLQKIAQNKDDYEGDRNYGILKKILNENSVDIKEGLLEDEIISEVVRESKRQKNREQEIPLDIDENSSIVAEELESPQYFNTAGMVLLHPFLSSFFRKLNLTEGKEFTSFESKSKAVLLLHFLATGQEQPNEYDLVLPKFLCDMRVNMPIDYTLHITDEEKEEANTLLEVVIEHWGALGSSSPNALREGFLSRSGKLEKETSGWKLFVEQNTIDILLDQLPWNIGIIKLPWMKEMLKVEWR